MNTDLEKLEDQRLARRFSDMRSEDSRLAPEFSTPVGPGASAAPFVNSSLTGMALAASLIVGVGLWFAVRPTPEDPASLYLAVMDSHQITTDELLLVSDWAAPEMMDLPAILSPAPIQNLPTVEP